MTNEEIFQKHIGGRPSQAVIEMMKEVSAAERSRLLSQAGVPTQAEYAEWHQIFFNNNKDWPDEDDVFNWMRSRCAALLEKEREKITEFAEWIKNEGWGYYDHDDWGRGDHMRPERATTAALLLEWEKQDR